ncbi:dihydroorotate dehydrogenase electron transfer subunit [Microbacterium gubbeenense]|uniref:dihydroorotate dehydrogenase electron transfer subunit n=1 Tax=Microbacterium gubbeenense TaxID=159896 RepID=UPI000428F47F|nr:dihydroorotate dehydrogenase electron transfer subunit [Microbacterium gubbeenense]
MIPAALSDRLRVQSGESLRPEPTSQDVRVLAHEAVSETYRRLVLHAPDIARRATAGQFVMVTVPSASRVLLPRPMAIHRRRGDVGTIEVIYGVVGRGTRSLAEVATGSELLVTGPLGRGYEIPDADGPVLLIGRGIGICAFMTVAEDAVARGIETTAVLSARTASRVIGEADCRELGIQGVAVTDVDGTSDTKVLQDWLEADFGARPPRAIFVCGSSRLALLAARLGDRWGCDVQVSLEAHMACGIGYCHGCAAPTRTDPAAEGPLVCVDGPVFDVIGSGT